MLKQIIISIGSLKISKDFILHHRIWDRWQHMKWANTAFTLLAIYFGLKMFGALGESISNLGNIVSGDFENVKLGFSGGGFLSDWSFIKSDTYKYIFLFFTMSLVYHAGGRTVEILYGVPFRPDFNSFVRSQIRTLTAILICYILEQVLIGLGSGLLGISGTKWMLPLLKFLIRSFLFGAVIVDGLHEARGTSINQGLKNSLNYYPGIALFFGSIGLLLSYVPIIGVLVISSLLTVGILIAIKRVEAVPGYHL